MTRSDISPELVLVDPDLAKLARALLGPPGELPPHARTVVPTYEPRVGREQPVIPAVVPQRAQTPSPALMPAAITVTAPPLPEPAPVAAVATGVIEPVVRRRRGFLPTLLAASLALNAALAWDIIGSAGRGPQLAVLDPPIAAEAGSEPAPQGVRASPLKREQSSTRRKSQAAKITRQERRDSTKHTAPTQQQKQEKPHQQLSSQAKARATPAKTTNAVRPSARTKHRESTPDAVSTSVRLSWDPAEGATFYNVVLWRDSTRLLDLWPRAPNVRIPGTWTYRGKNRRLEPGRYLWFAFAGYGTGHDRRVGPRVASGDVVVDR